jgi:putative two-component system response regulator
VGLLRKPWKPGKAKEMPGQTARKIILAVDDMPVNLAAIRNTLSGEYDVRPVKSPKTALLLLNTIRPDLILLDVEMPEMSGFEFYDQLKNNPDHPELGDIPVVFITSHGGGDVVARAMSSGARGCMVKPVEPAALLKKVSSCFGDKGFS